jgi:hypothetical protein
MQKMYWNAIREMLLSYCNFKLIPLSKVILGNLMIIQVLKKFTVFYGTGSSLSFTQHPASPHSTLPSVA